MGGGRGVMRNLGIAPREVTSECQPEASPFPRPAPWAACFSHETLQPRRSQNSVQRPHKSIRLQEDLVWSGVSFVL